MINVRRAIATGSDRRMARAAIALALVTAGLVAAGCGGGEGEEGGGGGGEGSRSIASVDVGDARLATNGPADDLIGGSVAPHGGVVEGEPPSRSAPPPAAVGSPRRSCTGGELQPSAANLRLILDATLCLLNIERETRGLSPLRANRRLARAASSHSRDMVRRSYFAHDSRSGASFVDRIRRAGYLRGPRRWLVGENLGWGGGSESSPRAVVEAWMNSPPHRANILQRRFREVGIGIALGAPEGSRRSTAATYSTSFGARRRG